MGVLTPLGSVLNGSKAYLSEEQCCLSKVDVCDNLDDIPQSSVRCLNALTGIVMMRTSTVIG